MIAAALLLVAGGTTGAVLATSGPSAAQLKAHAAKVAALAEAQTRQAQNELLAALTVSPAAGASAVPLNSQVTITSQLGTIKSASVKSSAGSLGGHLLSNGTKWVSVGALQPSSTYRVTVVLAGLNTSVQKATTFTTLTPVAQVTATVWPSDSLQVGVGQPIVVTFDHYIDSVTAQKAVESHFTVAESKPVPGGWYWFSQDELHFRPKTFWPSGEQIKVTADLSGWNAGEGRWGAGQLSDSFSIGDARISYANLDTEEMTVTLNGATIATYPISGGRTQYPTMDGTHIVLDREPVVHMVSSTVGIPVHSPNGYDEYVYDDVHISDSGEYVHAAPWSVGAQGVTNVSHGCINVSPSHALSFYNFSRIGDVVEVTGSIRPPATGDHGVMDWSTPWSEWTPGKVVALAGSVPAPAPTTTLGQQPTPVTTAATAPPATTTTTTRPVATTTSTTKPSATTTTKKG